MRTISVYIRIKMKKTQTTARQRVNITLPRETLRLLDRVAKKGNRSRLIDQAVRFYIEQVGRDNLRRQLKAGALEHAQRDLELAEEWFALEEEVWPKNPA